MKYGYKPGDGYKPVSTFAVGMKETGKYIYRRRVDYREHRFTEEQIARMGKDTDPQIAEDAGCHPNAVYLYRKRYGIKSVHGLRGNKAKESQKCTR